MNAEANRYFKGVQAQFGEETSHHVYGLIKEVSKESAKLITVKKMENYATNEALVKVTNEFKVAIADLQTAIEKNANNNLKWTIFLWVAQLGALAGIIKFLLV